MDRLPLAKRLASQFTQLTERLEDLSETAHLVDQMGATLPRGPFRDDFELFRLDIIRRIKGAKAELEEIAMLCLAIVNDRDRGPDTTSTAAGAAGGTAAQVLAAAVNLSSQSDLLRSEVAKFLDTLRAA